MEEFPKKDHTDHAHTTAKAIISVIPVLGGPLVELFQTVFSVPIEKRKEVWIKTLAKTIDDLCVKVDGLTLEKLSNNPEFISICLEASNIAIRTHHEEKLKALNVAIKNSVLHKELDESKKMIFLRIVDQMTPLHIKVLHFFSYTDQYIAELNKRQRKDSFVNWSNASNVWDEYFEYPPKSSDRLLDIITNDLNSYGLIPFNKFHGASLNPSLYGFTKEFIEFISE